MAELVGRGYNYVVANVRGTGASTGIFGFLAREEQQDHHEVIEWIAAQDWSNGQVAASRVYRYDLALQPVAWRFQAGSRNVLKITQASDAALRNHPRKDPLFHNGQYQSRLHLPLLPDPLVPQTAPFAPFAAENQSPALPPTPPDPRTPT